MPPGGRCAPRSGAGGDPEQVAQQWGELGRLVRERARRAGIDPLVPPQIWEVATDPATWGPEPAPGQPTAAARILGGRRADHRSGFDLWTCSVPTVTGGTTGHILPGVVTLWQPHLWRHRPPTPAPDSAVVAVAGLPPGWTADHLGSGFRDNVVDRLRWVLSAGTFRLADLGGAATDILRVGARTRLRRIRALAHLVDGTGGARIHTIGPTAWVTPPGWRSPTGFHAKDLATGDPRLARRFLNLFDWEVWLRDNHPRVSAGPTGRAVVSWLCSVAAADRAAARVLLEHPLRDTDTHRVPVVLALRTAGHQVDTPIGGPDPGTIWAVPVLWWRRELWRLVGDHDRLRAVNRLEAAWVRLWTGR